MSPGPYGYLPKPYLRCLNHRGPPLAVQLAREFADEARLRRDEHAERVRGSVSALG